MQIGGYAVSTQVAASDVRSSLLRRAVTYGQIVLQQCVQVLGFALSKSAHDPI